MQVLNGMDLLAGKRSENNRMGSITQPSQFLTRDQKNEAWSASVMDWIEWQGLRQLRRTSNKMLKNFKLANGQIEKGD